MKLNELLPLLPKGAPCIISQPGGRAIASSADKVSTQTIGELQVKELDIATDTRTVRKSITVDHYLVIRVEGL